MKRWNRRAFLASGAGLFGSVAGCLRLAEDQTPTSGDATTGTTARTATSSQNPTPAPTEADTTTDAPEQSTEEPSTEPAEDPEEATGTPSGSIAGAWPQFKANAGNTGHAPTASGPTSLPEELWTYTAFDSFVVDSNPIIAEGTLVIGNDDNTVYALNAADGTERWSQDVGMQVWGTPAYHDGTVLVGSGGGDNESKTTAFDLETGDPRWERQLNMNQLSPAVHQGRAYFAAGELQAIDIDSGSTVWAKEVEGKTSPAIADGVVYVGSGGAQPTDSGAGRVFAFQADDGSEVWRTRIDEKVTKRCQHTAAEGTVFVGGHEGTLFALDATNGDTLWSFSVGDGILSSPAVVDGTAYVGSGHWDVTGKHVFAIDIADGTEQWRFDAGAKVFSSPAVVDGIVYVGDHNGSVIALDAGDGSLVWRASIGDAVDSSPVVLDDTVFVPDRNGTIHALQEPA